MKKLLLSFCTVKQAFPKALAFSVLMMGLVLVTSKTQAQAITESFEEAGWNTTLSPTAFSSVVGATAPSTTNASWSYSALIISTNGGTTVSNAKTGKGVNVSSSSGSFVCTPFFGGGVTTVTLAVWPTSATTKLLVGVATASTTATGQLTSSYSTTAVGSSVNGLWSMSMYSAGVNMVSGTWNTITFTTNIPASQSAYLKFQRCASGAVTIDDIVVTGAGITPPTLTAAVGATVDAPFIVTFPDDATWRGLITGITVGGVTLTAGSAVAAGQITFTPSASSPANLLQTSGTKTIAVKATGYADATVSQAIGAGAATKLGITQQPTAPGSNGGALITPPAVAVQDQYGNTVTSSSASILATAGGGSWTIGGVTNPLSATSGVATFTGMTATAAAAVPAATITFSSAGLTSTPASSSFAIPAPLPLYRSNNTGGGNWNSPSTWEVSTNSGGSWSAAVSTPTSADGTITIRGTDVVTVTVGVTIDETTIDAAATLTVNSAIVLVLANGPGTDITINGTMVNSGNPTWTGTGVVNGTYVHNTSSSSTNAHVALSPLSSTSTWIYRGTSVLSPSATFSGRTYGNLTIESTSGAMTVTGTGSGALAILGNLNVGGAGAGTATLGIAAFTGAVQVDGNVTIGTGHTLLAPASIMSVDGVFANTGTFTSGTGNAAIAFTGSSQTVPNFTYNRLTINGTGTAVTTAGTTTVNSVLTVTTPFTVGAGSTLTLGTGATVPSTAGVLTVLGTLTSTATATPTFTSSTSTLLFATGSGAGVFNLNGAAVHIPTATWVNGANVSTLNWNSSANASSSSNAAGQTFGDWVVASNAAGVRVIYAGANSTITMRDLTISNAISQLTTGGTGNTTNINLRNYTQNASINLTAYATTVNLLASGNVTINSGTLSQTTGGTSTLTLNGTSSQTITGMTPAAVSGVIGITLTNTAGASLGSDLASNGVLNFNSAAGKITTGANSVIIGTTGTITGASSTEYVDGNLAKTFANATASPSFTFPVGEGAVYAPVSFTGTGTTTALGTLTASTTAGDLNTPAGSNIHLTNRVHRYWTATNTGITGLTSFGATFNYPSGEAGGTPANYLSRYTDAASWYSATISGTPTTTVTSVTGINDGSGSIIAAGVTNQFIIGETGCTNVSLSDVVAGASPICALSTTTLTATFDGTNALLTWYDGPGATGGTHGTGSPSAPVNPGTYYAYVTGDCGGPLEQSVVVGLTNTNVYSTTGAWSTDGNWSCGYDPTSGQDVVIANGGHPTLDVDFTAAGSLTLQSTSSLTVAPTITLTVSGAADFGGQPVTFQSNASGSAAFGNLTGSVTGDGAVTVERYIPATARAWRLLTIPVASSTATIRDAWAGAAPIASAGAASGEAVGSGTLITGHGYANAGTANAAGFDYIDLPGTASSIRRYVSGNWPSTVAGTPSMTTTYNAAEQGYMLFVRGDRQKVSGSPNVTTLRPTGSLKTGTQGYALTATFVKVVGNPYASAIDFATAYGHNGTVAENRFWRWDANNGTNGGYVIVQDDGGGGYETVPNEGTTNITQIQSGQAVFLKGASGGTFNIAESDKVPAGTPVTVPVVFDATNAPGKLFTNMYFDNGVDGLKLIDGVQARFADRNSVDMDANDISKISNFNENISFLRNGNALSVEAHPMVTGDDILYLSTEKLAVRNYAFKFTSKNMQSGITAILQDTYLGKESEIGTADNALTEYHFTVTADAASAATDRFRIVFKGGTLPLTLTNAKAYSLSSGVQVDWKTVNERGLRSYEVEKSIDGRSFAKATTIAATGAGAYGWYDAAPVKGNNYYRIKGVGTNGDASYSQVLMVNLNSGKSAFSVYPNPVKGGIVGVQFSNMEKGKYSMVVYNSAGQKVVSRDITHLGGSATEEINLGTMSSGVYRISLISTGGSVQNQTLVIQK